MHTDALQRAQLLRSVAEVLSTDVPLAQLWMRCCTLLSTLMEAGRITIAVREAGEDRIAFLFGNGTGTEPVSRVIRPGSAAAEVLALGETVVRSNGQSFAVGVPIRFGRTLLGAICLDEIGIYDAEQTTLLESCALHIGARLNYESGVASRERFAELAFTDGLTGIPNRRRFDESFEREWARAVREEKPLSLLMIDLDFFKSFNDNYGHQLGDLCLQKVAQALQACAKRPADLVARYGGEEFVALLPDTNLAGATATAEEMRTGVAALDIDHAGSSLGHVSLSIGVAAQTPSPGSPHAVLLHDADAALYRAKLGGRNRVYAGDYETHSESARPRRTSTQNNLPLQLTRLIGREEELAQIASLLDHHRLVSVAGAGGTGKTRVAIAASESIANRFRDGVWFVDLSPIADPALIAPTIASLFGIHVALDDGALDALTAGLEAKEALLLLDNCEHLVADVTRVAAALLRRAPWLKIVATTREPLGIAGEAIYRLPLLSTPAAGARLGAADAMSYDAVALFVERATEAARTFRLTDDNVAAVVEICRVVDGIALAIELAASRVGIIGLAHLAQRLRDVRLLTGGGDRSALPRQQTMQATIAWSYDLLSNAEQALFRRLSIFAGGFTFEAVTEACATDVVTRDDLFELLSGLIRKSLVADDAEKEGRYRLLEPVRAFARERLLDAGETERTARRHAEYYESVARSADPRRTPTREWIDSLEPDLDNFRVALEWTLDERRDVVFGAALMAACLPFFNDVMPGEAVRWLCKALQALPPGAAPALEARLSYAMALTTRNLPAEQIRAGAERAIAIYRDLGDREGLAEALRGAAQIIGWYFRSERELADAYACESIALARELGDPILLALALRTRGLTIDISDFPSKRAALEESLALMRAHGNDRLVGGVLSWISDLEFSAGDVRRALEYGREAMSVAEHSGSNELYGLAAVNLANYAIACDELGTARTAAVGAIRMTMQTREAEQFTHAIQAVAVINARTGHLERAARLLGFCETRYGIMHPQRQADQSEDILNRQTMVLLRERLAESDLARFMREGAMLSEGAAVKLATD